jgi:hypothetical protein
VTLRLNGGITEPEELAIVKKQCSKQVPVVTNIPTTEESWKANIFYEVRAESET